MPARQKSDRGGISYIVILKSPVYRKKGGAILQQDNRLISPIMPRCPILAGMDEERGLLKIGHETLRCFWRG
jgi:hypothetical protein